METPVVELWFELASTYSYPAVMRITDLAARAGVEIRYRTFLLGPIFAAQGWKDSPFNIYPAKGRYMWRDLERTCEGLGLPFRKPSTFPRGSLVAARVAASFAEAPWIGAFVRAVYTANFAEDREIGDPNVVHDVLTRLGLDAKAILEVAQSETGKGRLREQTEEAIAKGIFGAPTLIAGAELFWGNDRLEAALDWARRHGS